jgi:hypothetical protein
VIAVPDASPPEAPVSRRPMRSPGRAFHAASTPAATIMVTTALTITPRRPMRAAMGWTTNKVRIVLAAKIP